MLVFNKNAICSNKFSNVSKSGKGKNMKKSNKVKAPTNKSSKASKSYKRIGKGKDSGYSCKLVSGEQSGKSIIRKKISKKNTQFLEGLGLKVKQKQ